ncbi:flagellar type III secretion system pore protein FliP [Escherichia coli]|nr:flagellar type III secretion system pore protein FliP [Escherichia coli]EEZ5481083.1 flagellar type III secretion system pore protein FliP [Escherichia coli]EFK9208228.1 flagellar type III secretion system pore protein FliP [Escherichia coli]EFL6356589.1 flagellar type III secretion system pore protein FliP [Escherichia coli]
MRRLLSVAPVLLWLITPLAFAQLPGITSQPLPGGGQSWSLPVQTLVFITSLTFIPAILLMMTSFTRIIIVFGLLRNALGTPSAPPNQVLLGLALFLTFFIMSPVIDKIYVDAYQPFSEEKISMQEALEKGAQPLREFMLRQTREADLGLFARLANTGPLQGPEAVPMRILLPAYVTSELKTAFQIGFTIFIPFLIIDLVIASVLMALGMMMVPPATIALPFKLMLFVLVDGWQLLVGSLALAAPLLLVALVTGLIISILQAATQINEMTLSFIPKIIAVFIAIIIAGPWMLNLLLDYVRTLFTNLPYIIG